MATHVGRRQSHSIGGDIFLFSILFLIGAFMVLPFIYAISQSLKPMEELFVFPPKFFVRKPTIDNFTNLLLRTNNMWVPLERYLVNSVWVTIVTTAGGVLLAAMAAYPLAKFKFPGSNFIATMMTLALLFVYDVTAVPTYVILNELKLLDTQWALILPAMASTLGLYLIKQFMSQIPTGLIEAAMIDGAGTWRQFWAIIMPNTKPAVITAIILTFQAVWNRDSSSLIYTEQSKNLPALFRQITATSTIATAGISAAVGVIMMLPPIIVFIYSQSRMIETMAHSGLKG